MNVELAGADESYDAKSFWDNLRDDVEVEEERQPRTPHNTGRPTKDEERLALSSLLQTLRSRARCG